jgi:flagellar hook-associated protein 1
MIRGTFLGIEIAKKGLMAARAALDTTGHNIANANTEGYSRQRVNIKASYPLSYPGPFVTLRPGQIGTGAEVTSITRIRSEFIDAQIQREGGSQQKYEVMDQYFTRIQDIMGEPSENGINGLMESFFNAWEDLANDPESASTRTNLRESATALTNFVNEVDFKLKEEVESLNDEISERVTRINSLAQQIADVNKQIVQLEGSGQSNTIKANDLKDRRDLFIEEMSGLINARVIAQDNGALSVLVQGHPIVSGQYNHEIGLKYDPNDPTHPVVEFTKSRIPLNITSGELAGLYKMRDEEIPKLRSDVSQLVSAFTNRVNELHLEGYGLDGNKGRPFFADNETRRLAGTIPLPATTTLDTTLDQLGITSGDFFVQGQRIAIKDTEVLPGSSITVRQLLNRIEDTGIDIRAKLDTSLGFSRIQISQYNPVDADSPLTAADGSSNFFEVTGLKTAVVQTFASDPAYENSLYNFRLNSTILADLDTIAATGDDGLGYPGAGDNRTALAIADLKNDNKAIYNTTFSQYFQGTVATLGSAAQNVGRSYESQKLVVEQLNARREEISGVNLDEEAVSLIKYQRAFEASSRAMTTVDETLDLIVNRLGTVGR